MMLNYSTANPNTNPHLTGTTFGGCSFTYSINYVHCYDVIEIPAPARESKDLERALRHNMHQTSGEQIRARAAVRFAELFGHELELYHRERATAGYTSYENRIKQHRAIYGPNRRISNSDWRWRRKESWRAL